MKIAILAGGLSPERDVSLSSGALIAAALIKRGHSVALLDVYMDSQTHEKPEDSFTSVPPKIPSISSREPNLKTVAEIRKKLRGGNEDINSLVGRGVIEICRHADITFLALHGAMGENGQLQAYLDCCGIKYTGSGYAGCLLAMDKDISKRLVRYEGIETAEWLCMDGRDISTEKIMKDIGLPCIIKPSSCGSSVGISIAKTEEELKTAIEAAKIQRQDIIAERFISGAEFSVGVLCGEALPSIEIIPMSGFYDYENKYQQGHTREITPADIPESLETRLRNTALRVHKILRLGSYSRSDFIYDKNTDKLFFLEANTLPGMTPTSLLPQEAAAAGLDYETLCERIALSPASE